MNGWWLGGKVTKYHKDIDNGSCNEQNCLESCHANGHIRGKLLILCEKRAVSTEQHLKQ